MPLNKETKPTKHIQAKIYTNAQVQPSPKMLIPSHIHTRTHIYIRNHTCIYTYIYTRQYTGQYICIDRFTDTHIHTYTINLSRNRSIKEKCNNEPIEINL